MAAKRPKPHTRSKPPPSPAPGVEESPSERAYQPTFPIVGIGASAGGLEAFTQLLQALPTDTGMAFVLVQHLSPDRVSMLPEILGRATSMPVAQVQGEPLVQPNHVYIIPPGRDMCVTHGVLELVPRTAIRGQHRPIDQFFRSLAEDQAHCAIGVILSGTANDGTQGLAEIKAEGGLTFAQDHTAQQDSMPRSAVATGCVDFVLPPEGIAQELVRISQHPLTAPEPADGAAARAELRWLGRIVLRLSENTGVEFARYKASTVSRRISRRMALHHIRDWKEYETFLQSHPAEMDALYQDMLIHVTRFFRDPEVFEALKADVLPRLFRDRTAQEPIRIWVLGCSSGEEAYSLAMICAEFAEEQPVRVPVQVFASDLSARMIEKARTGVYPPSIAQDVSPERLRRFFSYVNGSYHVNRSIRDSCVFAPHNVLADPPFSRMDLVSCRNLLIYLEPALQEQVLSVLQYALHPGGFLLLGKSETTGTCRDLFEIEDARYRFYTRKPGGAARLTVSRFPSTARDGRLAPPVRARNGSIPAGGGDVQREAERFLATRYAPPGVLVDADLEILQFWGDTSPYLASLPGKATLNVLRMARPGLLIALRTALQKARLHDGVIRQEGLRTRSDTGANPISLEVVRVPRGPAKPAGFLILFETTSSSGGARLAPDGPPLLAAEGRYEAIERENLRLTQELEGTRDYLQAMIEQEQAFNEELQSAGEESQSANEELQSINEELETSKEEIQATNEELTTVNDELHARNQDLHRISTDWANLLESVEVPIIILSRDLRIRRYSPLAGDVLNLIPADVGRPISDVNLSLPVNLEPLVLQVMHSQAGQEVEVQRHGRWYSLRLRPYRSQEQTIEGAVLVFVDVDRLKRAQQYSEAIVATVREPLLVLDHELRVRTANRFFRETFRVTAEETEGRLLFELGRGQWDHPELRQRLGELLQHDTPFEDLLVEREFESIGAKTMRLNARRLPAEPDAGTQILLAIEDITARRALDGLLQRRLEELAAADLRRNEFLAMLAHELRNPLAPIIFANEILTRRVTGDPTLERQCELIDRQSRQLGHLLEDLLEVSRATQGKVTLRRLPLDLGKLIEQVVSTAALAFELRRQVLTYVGPAKPLIVDGDPVRLEQILSNLLNNASKYTDLGGTIRVVLEAEANTAVVRVIDNGMGISPELLPRIFELFTQGDRTLDRSQGGLGIGLMLVFSLVALHGGTVEAQSEGVGRGSEFVVRLPLLKNTLPSPEDAAPVEMPAAAAAPALPRPRLLVVDDNHDSADTLADLGVDWGYAVRCAYDGLSAIELAREYRPQIILLDIGLPGLDGYEVARRLRAEPALNGVRLVAFTGYGSANDRERSQEAGFDHHLTKPVDPHELESLFFALLCPPGGSLPQPPAERR